MKTFLTRSILCLTFAAVLSPVACFARPVRVTASRQSVVRDRSPRVQTHESVLHHS